MSFAEDALADLAWSQVWQVTLAALLVGILVRFACRRRPHLAYVLWLLVLLKCLTPPVWSSPLGIFSWAQATVSTLPPTDLVDEAVIPLSPLAELPKGEARTAWPVREVAVVETPQERPQPPWSVAAVLARLWLSGALMCAGLMAVCWAACAFALRKSAVAADATLIAALASLATRLGIARRVRLRVASRPLGPAAYGVFRPVIVVPQAMLAETSAERLELILAHELIHIRRWDPLVGMVQLIAQILWWFHPLVWWANREASRERERCCDEAVLAELRCPPAEYAQGLLDVLKRKRQLRPLFAFSGVRALEVTHRRLEHIMNDRVVFQQRMPRRYWLVLAAGLLILVPGAGLTLPAPLESADGGGQSKKAGAEPAPSDKPKTEPSKTSAPGKDSRPAQRTTEPPRPSGSQEIKYDGKGFDEWREIATNDLKPENKVEAVYALRTFGVNGRRDDAIRAIIDIISRCPLANGQREGQVLQTVHESLVILGPSAVSHLVKVLQSSNMKEPYKHARVQAISALQAFGPKAQTAVPLLLQSMKDDDQLVRIFAMNAVLNIDPKAGGYVPALVTTVKDDNPPVAIQAIELVRNYRQRKEVLPAVKEVAAKHKEDSVRQLAIMRMSECTSQSKEAAAALIDIFPQIPKQDRMVLVDALERLGVHAQASGPVLVKCYREAEDVEDRVKVLQAVIRLKSTDKALLELLQEAKRDKDEQIHRLAIDALQKSAPKQR